MEKRKMKVYILTILLGIFIKPLLFSQNTSDWQIIAQPPSFVGGEKALKAFIKQNLTFLTQDSVEGTVFVGFTIAADGSVINIHIKRGLHPALDKEAIRIFKLMPKWIPAYNDKGKAVPCMMTYPLRFKLE